MSLSPPVRSVRLVCRACRRRSSHLDSRRSYTSSALSSNPGPDDIFDVALVGGGPVGLALLTAIKSNPTTSHLKCTLIESQSLQKQISWLLPRDKYSNRASSITPTNASFLERIGVWQHTDLRRVQPYDEMQVWDGGNDSSMVFDWKAEAVKYNAPLRTVATMIENANLTKGLLQRLSELGAQDSLCSETRVESIGTGLDEGDAMDLSSWPVLTLQTSDHGNLTTRKRHIAARLLIGADGINSPVRVFAGLNSYGWDYNRHGVVATLHLQPQAQSSSNASEPEEVDFDAALNGFLADEPSDTREPAREASSRPEELEENRMPSNRATAYQRFLPACGGPIAILPLPDNFASLVWSTTPQIAAYLKTLPSPALIAMINAALRLDQVDIKYMLSIPPAALSTETTSAHESELSWRLQHTHHPTIPGPIPRITNVQEGTLASFPLRLRNASAYVHPRVALAGDAAHTIHPLAGQGLNLGLGDAEALARTIAHAVERGADIGDLMTLEAYSQERYSKSLTIAGGVDIINTLYSLGGGIGGGLQGALDDGFIGSLIGRARGIGMNVVAGGWIPGLKETIMRRAE